MRAKFGRSARKRTKRGWWLREVFDGEIAALIELQIVSLFDRRYQILLAAVNSEFFFLAT